MLSRSVCLISLLLPSLLESRTPPGKQVVWQIGKFDESSYEFRRGGTLSDAEAVFEVGKSAMRDWPAEQAGTSNGVAGHRPHPFTIKFELPELARDLYQMRIALLTYSPRLPALEVRANGHGGRFYLQPELNYASGTASNHFVCHYASALVEFDLPTAFLRKGLNTLVLTAIDDPNERDDSRGTTVLGNSSIVYDALALFRDSSRSYTPAALTTRILPTIFYQTGPAGLLEQVEVVVRHHEAPQRGTVALALAGQRHQASLESSVDFGEQRFRFNVAEFSGPAEAITTVAMNGARREFRQTVQPGKKWNIFVAPHQHMDIGYTDYPAKVAELQSRAIDQAMEMMEERPEFRYTLDSYWVAEQYLAGRSEEQRRRFLRLVGEKKIFVPAQYAANYTGVASLEYLLRSFYHSYRLSSETGSDFDHAFITDIPSHSGSYPSVVASAGIKYLLLPSNQDLGPILLLGRLHEKSPFWWEGPDGQRVFTWYARHYLQVASMFGLPPRVEAGRDSLPTFLQMYTRPDYKSDGVLVFGTQVENTALVREQASLAAEWNRVYAWPRLRFTGVSEALGYISGQMGDSAPVLRGDGGPYWDIFSIGSPQAAALARESEHRVLAAERFSTIASLLNPQVRTDSGVLDRMWRGLLTYREHTGSGGRDARTSARHAKPAIAVENARLVEWTLMRGLSAIGEQIQAPAGTLMVFNPLNWARNKLVEVDLPRNTGLFDLVTGRAVPVEELAEGGGGRVRFLAEDVPSVGYRNYGIRSKKPGVGGTEKQAGAVLENAYYRITLDPATGAIASVIDKELNREMADRTGPYRFGQYIVACGEQDRRSAQAISPLIVAPPKLDIASSSAGRIISVTKTPFGSVARLESSTATTPRIATEVILHDREKKIEINFAIAKGPGTVKEWGYVAFPFAMRQPEFRFEIQNGIINPACDVLPGGSREWTAVQHWVAADEDDVSAAVVPVDAPLVALGDVVRYNWPKEFGARGPTIYSLLFQGGRGTDQMTYRYVVTTGRRLRGAQLSRLGWEAMSPMETNEVIEQDKIGNPPRPLPEAQGSFVDMNRPGIVLVTWKQAEDGQGTIMRFVDTTGEAGAVDIQPRPLRLEKAWLCNAVETNQSQLPVSAAGFRLDFKPFQILTVRLMGIPPPAI